MGSRTDRSDIKKLFGLSHFSAGFVAVLVGYTSSAVIIFQAAAAAGASAAEISSWLWALGIGMAVTTTGLSLYYRTPVLTAWSTPGAALLITSLSGIPLNEAIGIFIFSSGLIVLCGLTGWFDKIMHRIPMSLAGAMLAGVLLQFCINLFNILEAELLLVGLMLTAFILVKLVLPRYSIPIVLLTGTLVALLQGQLQVETLSWELATPIWITPAFSLQHLIGIGIPLFIITMASQNVPGVAVLRANGYETPISPLLTWTGLTGVVLAPFGGFAFNLAAITAAICMGKEAGEDSSKRYFAALWAGFFYLLTGLFGSTIAALFTAFPSALVMAIAGLALISTIGNSLAAALADPGEREAAFITFLVTASDLNLLGISSAFWGLSLGLIVYSLQRSARANP